MTNKGPIGIAEQLNYLIQWFMEYSEMQKDDFYSILVDTYSRKELNGMSNSMNSLELNDRPPSIFQCRMKLFREWYAAWNEEEKNEFLARLGRMDEKFMEKFNAEMGHDNIV
ncbi:uncharacterized protein C14orf119-like [Stegodyphus dumicola]|uniref:uncharacterized protein C14orf119-like n=1 Tax=Stegodyphus dumicola TaxID=202533 RepID=UPI0015AEEFF5|nr:uncharacterized protein C14orf119-like [Stegodyphus dumicola]